MTPREIIAEAWTLTRRERSVRRWSYTTAFFELLLSIKLLSYQLYFLYEYLSGRSGGGFFDVEILIYRNMPQWFFWTFVISLTLLIVVELLFSHLSSGAIIGLIAKSHMGEPVQGGTILALYNFFPIFAVHEIFVLGSLNTTITVTSIVIRYVNGTAAIPIIIILWLIWLFSNLLRFFFHFAQEAIVIDRIGVFAALGKSFKLIISHLGKIMFLVVLMLVISIRIVLNAAVVFLIPGIMIGVVVLLSTFLSPLVTWIATTIISLTVVAICSYFFGYIHAFNQAVWTILYIELRKHKELDVIG
jgi:hypothetical protein